MNPDAGRQHKDLLPAGRNHRQGEIVVVCFYGFFVGARTEAGAKAPLLQTFHPSSAADEYVCTALPPVKAKNQARIPWKDTVHRRKRRFCSSGFQPRKGLTMCLEAPANPDSAQNVLTQS